MNALPQPAPQWVTEAEYLQYCEEHPEEKFELIDGEIVAMAGASFNHNVITGNIYASIHPHLKHSGCFVFASDWKIKVEHNFYFPDIVVDCDPQNKQPKLIVEVLSNSTRAIDLTVKLTDYQTIPTLKEYVIVEQDFIRVTVYRKRENWRPVEYISRDDVVNFESLDLSLPIMEIYDRIVFKDKVLRLRK